ncbi:MAG: hypothetical protein AAGH88_08765 [Planctomycetota bacterium]
MGWLVFSNLFVALCGAALTAATYPLLGQSPRIDAPVVLVFLGTLATYNLDRLVEPSPGQTDHERWVERHRKPLWVLTVLAGVGCLVSLPWLDGRVLVSLLVAATLSIGYCIPVYRLRGRWHRLKAVPGAKLFLIAGVWTYATAILPLLQSPVTPETDVMAVVVAGRLLFILGVALPFDLPDMARDRAAGIVTLPQRYGYDGTRLLGRLLIAGFGVLSALGPWPMMAALLVSAAVSFALLNALGPKRGVVYYELLLDGLLLVQAGLILVTWAGMSGVV